MGRLVLDTSVLVAIGRGGRVPPAAVDPERDDAAIAAVTLAELLVGIDLAPEGVRDQQAAHLDPQLSALEILPYDADAAQAHADLLVAARRAGRPRQAHDLIIAATARATNRTLVTFDRRAFDDLPGVSVRVPAPV